MFTIPENPDDPPPIYNDKVLQSRMEFPRSATVVAAHAWGGHVFAVVRDELGVRRVHVDFSFWVLPLREGTEHVFASEEGRVHLVETAESAPARQFVIPWDKGSSTLSKTLVGHQRDGLYVRSPSAASSSGAAFLAWFAGGALRVTSSRGDAVDLESPQGATHSCGWDDAAGSLFVVACGAREFVVAELGPDLAARRRFTVPVPSSIFSPKAVSQNGALCALVWSEEDWIEDEPEPYGRTDFVALIDARRSEQSCQFSKFSRLPWARRYENAVPVSRDSLAEFSGNTVSLSWNDGTAHEVRLPGQCKKVQSSSGTVLAAVTDWGVYVIDLNVQKPANF